MTTSSMPSRPPFSRSADLYDLLYGNKPYRQEAEQVNRHLRGPAVVVAASTAAPRLIEFGCGTGNYLQQFRDLGWNAIGIDPSEAMLHHARQKGLAVLNGDITEGLPLDAQFPEAVCCLFASFSYATVEPARVNRALSEVRQILPAGGRFVFDVVNYAAAAARLTRYTRREIHGDSGLTAERLMWKHFNPDSGIVEAKCRFSWQRPECPAEEWEELHRLRAFTPPEIRAAVERCGDWREIACFGTGYRDVTESPTVTASDYYFMVVLEAV